MKKEDLTGKVFGNLKVIGEAESHIYPSGRRGRMVLCECLLCGNKKTVYVNNIRSGGTTSCGCLANRGDFRSKKKCVICGKEFFSAQTANKNTCSEECSKKYKSQKAKERGISEETRKKIADSLRGKSLPEDVRRKMSESRKGRIVSEDTRKKISKIAKGRDVTELQKIGVEAAKASPKSGRFETNVNAMDWHLVSPDGKHYFMHSLKNWLRNNCEELFGCQPDTDEFRNVYSGLTAAKRAALGKGSYGSVTYKGWQPIPTKSDFEKLEQENG